MSVPALRFRNDDGLDFPKWETDSLGSLFTIKAGGDIARENVSETKNEVYKYPVFANSDKNLGLYGFSDKYKIDEEAITVTGRGNLGVAVPRHEPFYPIVRLLSLIPKNKFNIYFGATQINNINFHSESTGVPQLTAPQLANYELTYPSLPEQTKIANFLTAVDEKIHLITQKHDLLTQYKKGVMQQIFSQELRFKDDDGGGFPEWKETTLGDLCSITTGKLDANAMILNGKYRFYTCAKEYYRIDNYAFDADALLVSGNGANVGYIHHYKGKFNAYQRTYVLDRFDENIIFIKYFLDTFLHIRIFKEAKEGNTPYIVMGTLTEMLIQLPALKEQNKIANFLTAIDDKITATQSQLQAVKQYKQGLLQQMFV